MPDWKVFVRTHLRLEAIETREDEIVEDLAQQLEAVYDEAVQNGFSEEEARSAAEQHIPDWQSFAREIATTQKHSHDETIQIESQGRFYSGLWKDILFAKRMLLKNARFTLLAGLTIALGIAATAAIFSIVNGVLLKPIPYDDPDQIVWVWGKFADENRAAISPPDFQDYRSNAKSFEYFAAMHVMHQFVPAAMVLKSESGAIKLDSANVSAGFFEVFGAMPLLGRTFQLRDEQEEANTIVLSYSAWMNHFGADPGIVGKSVLLNQTSCTVVGVIEEGFDYPLGVHLWTPLNFASPEMKQRQFHFLRPIVKLRSDTGLEKAQAELATIAAQLEKQYPQSNRTWSVRLQRLQHQMVGDLQKPLFLILAAACTLLLIACVNVANLLLARATARSKEIAIRIALGAGKRRLLRQLFVENLLLSIPSGLIGFLFALWSVQAFRTAAPDFLPRLREVSVDFTVVLFAFACSIATAFLVSIVPAVDLLPRVTSERLKEGKFTGTRTAAGRMRQVLAIAEIALSVVLLSAAGLLLKSFWNLTHVDLGFQAKHLMTVRFSLNETKYPSLESLVAFVESAIATVERLPGVASAAASTGIPLIPAGGDRFFTIQGLPIPDNDAQKPNAQFRIVTKDYFRTLSIPILRGRVFSEEDHETSRKVVMVNDAFVRAYFPNEDPVGRLINIDMGEPFEAQIIGVVRGTRQSLAEEPGPEMYTLHKQSPMGFTILTVRTKPNVMISHQSVRNALQGLDPDLAFPKFRSMEEIVAGAAIRNRFNAILLGGAAALALLLAAIGIYGVLSFSVEQRKQEIGVRLALGAQRRDIVTLILHYGLRMSALGLLIGICGALVLTRAMQTLLFEVSPGDPWTLGAVSVLLGMVAILACWIPAYRATQIDPLPTLRYE